MTSAPPCSPGTEFRDELNSLFVRLVDGDRDAIDPAYRALWPGVHAFVARALGPSRAHEVDDVTQTALLKLFEQVARFDPERDAFAWALTVAGWEVRTVQTRARRARTGPLDQALGHASLESSPEERAVEALERQRLMDAIAQLAPGDQQVFAQVLADEHPTGSTFRKRRERAMTRLRAFLRDVHGT